MSDKINKTIVFKYIKKEIFETVGLFDEELLIEDLDMWLRISDIYPIGFINQVTASYRQHENNISLRTIEMVKSRSLILQKWRRINPSLFRKMKRRFELLALTELQKFYPEEAKKYLNITFFNLLKSRYFKIIIIYWLRGGRL
jgi:hypothetical protein